MARLVFLGTGTPNPDPRRQGPAIAIISSSQAVLVDCGVGVVRQAIAASERGVRELRVENLKTVFITHLHSDHTLGLPDLMLTPAVTGRSEGLSVFGPKGTRQMAELILSAYQDDIRIRIDGEEPSVPDAYVVDTHELQPMEKVNLGALEVMPFEVSHGAWEQALGYRFDVEGKVIVVSGDTTPNQTLLEMSRGCDVLVHEAYSARGLAKRAPEWRSYHGSYHTSGLELGRLAGEARPKLLLITHLLPFGEHEEEILEEIRESFSGEVRIANDLDVVEVV